MKKIAVILSGCGFQDGSEIHESTLTLLSLSKANIPYQCMAPNINQVKVYDYCDKQYKDHEVRKFLNEAGKIARCDILDIAKCDPNNYTAAIFPGGAGASTTLSNFVIDFNNYKVQKDILKFSEKLVEQKKPMGFICIAPCLIPGIYKKSIKCTIGKDPIVAKKLEQLGCQHLECSADDIVVDEAYKVVTTPAYMLAKNINEVYKGLQKLVNKINELS